MTPPDELHELTALELHQLLQRDEVTPVQAAEHFLARVDRLGAEVGAFAHVDAERAIERARHVERHVPKAAPLWGMPLADKDLEQRAGVPTRFGSRTFEGFVPDTSDALVEAVDTAGAVSLGKTATPEFGLPCYTEGAAVPAARDPWDLSRHAGGSSGGAAAAVAAGLLPFAPGSDGGGSVRIPAASCGLVGVKPSRGRVPGGSGLRALAGLVVAGPIARTVADAALLLDGLIAPGGYPAEHPFAVRAPGDDGPYLGAAIRGEGRFQIGVLGDTPWDDFTEIVLEPEARVALDRGIELLDGAGYGVEAIPPAPEPDYAEAFRAIWQAGAASIPVDGDRLELLEPLTRWLVGRGRALSARTLAESLAWLAEYERRTIRRFAPYDAVLTPALAMTPRPVGWYDAEDGERNFAQQVAFTPYTSFVNVVGLPAITLPMTFTEDGQPMGVQLIGRPGGEATLFAIASRLERAAGLTAARRRPPVW
ncbi:amidase [Agromyces aerolatus]|uniref:amidase n=1 Tax=Agromyces sp. LY-1074 TaxID=3074080 RepID=UPI0028611065|nr:MULTISPECIES: amidase [unclassified Agromyces]MDR5701825.1 amidase [Agromyces sp. LY-1074]MDR5707505.1 amidase [Agromyces sp. LY-1358]